MSALGDLIDATPDLLLHWPLDDTSGTTATDTSSAGLHGTYHGQVDLGSAGPDCADDASRSVHLDGDGGGTSTADYVHRATSPISGNVAHTHEVWIRPDVDAFNRPNRRYANFIQQRRNPRNDTGIFRVFASAFLNQWGLYYGADSLLAGSGGPLAELRVECWHHIAVTRDAPGGTVRIYLDGRLARTPGSSSAALTHENLSCGGDQPDIDPFHGAAEEMELFKGRLAHAAVYDRSLTADEIAARWALTCGCGGWVVGAVAIG